MRKGPTLVLYMCFNEFLVASVLFVRITSEKLSNEHWQMLSDPILSSERLQKNTGQDNYSKDHK